jgi:[acyl-carrier-protein] S-malonyltransferase
LSKIAFLFPGQGSQFVGMGKDLFESSPAAKELFDTANDIMGTDLAKICFDGPEEELKQTRITQPAIFVHSVVVHRLLQEKGVTAQSAAGHSLGEYSALVAAGALSFEDGMRLVKIRGELMQQAGVKRPGTMAAIIGLNVEQTTEVCQSVKDSGIVCAANYNSPGQVAISGEVEAVRAAMVAAKEMGAKRALELVVSGAFHSPLMEDAQAGLLEALQATGMKDAQIPVYTNVLAKPVTAAAELKELLFKQLTHPVRWTEIIENMSADGIATFYELGPGKVLAGLNRRINKEVTASSIGSLEEIEQFSA